MNRRDMLVTSGLGAAGFVVGTGFTAPACPFDGVTKDKAVRVTGFVIDLAKEAVPLLDLLGARGIATAVRDKAVPALEKLKDALSNADIPTAGSAFDTLRSVLGGVETALLNLPDSPRRTTVLGVLTSIKILLLTVRAFIESETPALAPTTKATARPQTRSETAEAIHKASEATRF